MWFFHSIYDHSLFIYHDGNNITYILLNVNDIILTFSSNIIFKFIIYKLHSKFPMNDLDPLSYFMGIFVA